MQLTDLLAAIATDKLAPESFGEVMDLEDGLRPIRLVDAAAIDRAFLDLGARREDVRALRGAWAGFHAAVEIDLDRYADPRREARAAMKGIASRLCVYERVS